MKRASWFLLLLAACEPEVARAEDDVSVRVVLEADPVVPGRAFALRVERAWRKGLVPGEFDDRSLAPLVVRLEGMAREEGGDRIRETRRYSAYAFDRKDVVVSPIEFRVTPKEGGPDRLVKSEVLRVRVRPTVDAKAPGAPELPGEPPRPSFPWWIVLGGLSAAAAGVVALRRVRRAPPTPEVLPAPVPVRDASVEALAALAHIAEESADRRVVATAEVVRGYVAERFGVPTRERTTEEVTASPAIPSRALLSRILGAADLVKFAAQKPGTIEEVEVRQLAEEFIRETGDRRP